MLKKTNTTTTTRCAVLETKQNHVPMKYILPLLVLSVISCADKKANVAHDSPHKVPDALADQRGSFSKELRGRGNLIADLYRDSVERSEALKQLEQQITTCGEHTDEVTIPFVNFFSKSDEFYRSADQYLATVNDTLLRKQVMIFLDDSEKRFHQQTDQIRQHMQQIADNNGNIHDRHVVLQTLVALQLMQTYQKEQQPDMQSLTNLVDEQGKAIENIKTNTRMP